MGISFLEHLSHAQGSQKKDIFLSFYFFLELFLYQFKLLFQ